jgi:hypothetical protein
MTVHIVPLMSHIPEAFESPSMYHFIVLPPRKYDDISRVARRDR